MILIIEWWIKYRCFQNCLDNQRNQIVVDFLFNFEMVNYFMLIVLDCDFKVVGQFISFIVMFFYFCFKYLLIFLYNCMYDQKLDEYCFSNILFLIFYILVFFLQVKYYVVLDFEIGRYDKVIYSFQVNFVVFYQIIILNLKLIFILINIKVFIKLCIFLLV